MTILMFFKISCVLLMKTNMFNVGMNTVRDFIFNQTYEHQDIAVVYSDGYCGLVEGRVYCIKFYDTGNTFPSLFHHFASIEFYFDDQDDEYLCGIDSNGEVTCWGTEEYLENEEFITSVQATNKIPIIEGYDIIDFDYSNTINSNLCYLTTFR